MIYQNSRYSTTSADLVKGTRAFKLRKRFIFNNKGAKVHHFVLGEHLDSLAKEYYGDPQLWWVILEANPQFRSELEIPYGTNLVIPHMNEVIQCLKY